ncbi:hypothetical protein [Microbulbifer epialgicus]|uniref:Uncharacterized protein n=1 Tax=Microbulbifer epialgicus TaxID=393907 RepID=A0ABV4NWX7_9GAMM
MSGEIPEQSPFLMGEWKLDSSWYGLGFIAGLGYLNGAAAANQTID